LHFLDREIFIENINGMEAHGFIDKKRRLQLRNHHTAAHIVFAASRETLGPHVWQHGAKKTEIQAHLDITHYSSLSYEDEIKIQNAANRIVMNATSINKNLVGKDAAELEHGFKLYQGGVVPGNELRVVDIEGTDVEACCGTHCDNTAEVGWIKIINTKRIADGVLRIYFVAGERTIDKLNEETKIINDIMNIWSIPMNQVVDDSARKFKEYKKLNADVASYQQKMFAWQMRYVIDMKDCDSFYFESDEPDPTLFFSFMPSYAKALFEANKRVVFQGQTFLFGFMGKENKEFSLKITEGLKPTSVNVRNSIGSKKDQVKGVCVISATSKVALPSFAEFFKTLGFIRHCI